MSNDVRIKSIYFHVTSAGAGVQIAGAGTQVELLQVWKTIDCNVLVMPPGGDVRNRVGLPTTATFWTSFEVQ